MAAIKALWPRLLCLKRLLILLSNSVSERDGSSEQQYRRPYLKLLALIFLRKLNNGAAEGAGRRRRRSALDYVEVIKMATLASL